MCVCVCVCVCGCVCVCVYVWVGVCVCVWVCGCVCVWVCVGVGVGVCVCVRTHVCMHMLYTCIQFLNSTIIASWFILILFAFCAHAAYLLLFFSNSSPVLGKLLDNYFYNHFHFLKDYSMEVTVCIVCLFSVKTVCVPDSYFTC